MEEIAADMASPQPMHRLLQGEVGSGKTVVAAFAAAVAVQGGFQAVILAPTEVLARQHALTLSQLLAPVDVAVGLLTSSVEEQTRRALAEELARGTLPVLVGTHAVLEPWVKFARLGLVVIDEQQKFGVDQRSAIAAKGDHPDLLVLTATPIPRTLALTLYGEMEISTIQEKPVGREPVRTLWVDSTRGEEIFTFVRSELDAGRQAYVVCPRIGDSAGRKLKRDLFAEEAEASQSALRIFEEYRKIFSGHSVGLLHGRMRAEEQRKVFAAFKRKEIQVLVATTVIEVGVDVPNATVMVVEGAQRFGLAQLHQLRGRVGRGEHGGTCILVADPSPASAERLQRMVETADGFQIAEEDLRLRGPGELLGKRQAGLPDLKCLQWAAQGPWLELAREEAETLLTESPSLPGEQMALLRREVSVRFPQLAVSPA
jgi:ATP-dependent DNA helicase RecG